jgi:hypothetical protein
VLDLTQLGQNRKNARVMRSSGRLSLNSIEARLGVVRSGTISTCGVRRLAVLITICAALIASIAPPGAAAVTLNSSCAPPDGGFYGVQEGSRMAQTFLANSSGALITVDILKLSRLASASDPDLTVEVYGTDGSGTPVAPVLASTAVPGSSIEDDGVFHNYTAHFASSSAAQLTSGQRYAVAITTTDTVQNAWNYGLGDPCPDGALYIGGPPFAYADGIGKYDSGLKTYVEPPAISGPPSGQSPAANPPPNTKIAKVIIKQAKRSATFRFTSTDKGASFRCKLDGKPYRSCRSPKTYRNLKPAKHRFRVQSIDPAGNLDPTPASIRFRIRG